MDSKQQRALLEAIKNSGRLGIGNAVPLPNRNPETNQTVPLPNRNYNPQAGLRDGMVPVAATPFSADVSKLTPDELVALNYHRQMLLQNLAQKNADGSLTTYRGAVVGTPEGETYLPTYWHGEVRDVPQAMRFMLKSGMKFPTYKTVDDALAAEKRIHAIMEQDVWDYAKRK